LQVTIMSKLLQDTRGSTLSKSGAAQQGSALLIVLGFLTFMLISAVSFSIYMRIERQASSNYRHSVTARHLLNAGLTRAIDEVDRELRASSLKFPNWNGRVYTPLASNSTENVRVLSLEALSFIPGIFVNDVRRIAANSNGVKWRTLPNGRYAYVCVNLSDMLNVNEISASSDGTNRISISHLFADVGKAKAFNTRKKNTDIRYETLQDFYACMYESDDPTFGSPYHEWLAVDQGNAVNADAGFADAVNHVLVTDSIVKPEFAKVAKPCNIVETQPVKVLSNPSLPPSLQSPFFSALFKALGNPSFPNQDVLMATLITDYLDSDPVPRRFDMPSVEMVPMVSRIFVPNLMMPTIRQLPDTPFDPSDPVYVNYIELLSPNPSIEVELIWPFKNFEARTTKPAFKIEVKAYLLLEKEGKEMLSNGFGDLNDPQFVPLEQVGGSTALPADFWDPSTGNYKKVPVRFKRLSQNVNRIDIIKSKLGSPALNGFTLGKKFSVSLIVCPSVLADGSYVDIVPHETPSKRPLTTTEHKLFFQTDLNPVPLVDPAMSVPVSGIPLEYVWNDLEVPDPRFNYRSKNWIGHKSATIPEGINPSTDTLLKDKTGRDGDIYMSVSDTGEMQSPGELGFILRPFAWVSGRGDPGFRFIDNTLDDVPDKEAMFRTIRLYDHGAAYPRDTIYDYFSVGNPADDTPLPGGTRVNPLSDLPQVLVAAVQGTPVDYYWAGQKTGAGDHVFRKTLSSAAWDTFTNGWFQCLQNAKNNSTFNTRLNSHLSDVYGQNNLFDWYTAGKPNFVFAQDLKEPLHEIDRKMLFDYTLNNFSDRQQLFLYILCAEVRIAAFGSAGMSRVKSSAGGRAVALVWRDPYPRGYSQDSQTWYHDHRILFFKQLDN